MKHNVKYEMWIIKYKIFGTCWRQSSVISLLSGSVEMLLSPDSCWCWAKITFPPPPSSSSPPPPSSSPSSPSTPPSSSSPSSPPPPSSSSLQLYEGLREKLPAYARPIFVRLVNKIDVTGKHPTVSNLCCMKIAHNVKYYQPLLHNIKYFQYEI